MKKELKLMAVAALAVLAASCSSAQKMVDEANNVKVTCNPAVLEAVAGNVDADLTVTYPAKYFLPKAVLEVTPVLVYNGGEAKMSAALINNDFYLVYQPQFDIKTGDLRGFEALMRWYDKELGDMMYLQ